MMSPLCDTSRAAGDRYFELLRQRSPRERAVILAGLVSAVRQLARASERAAHPDLPARAVEARVAARLYGATVAARFFPDIAVE